MPSQQKKAGAPEGGEGEKASLLELLMQNVLKNPYIWGMALTYFCIYAVRQGVTSWFVFYLMKVSSFHTPGGVPLQNITCMKSNMFDDLK